MKTLTALCWSLLLSPLVAQEVDYARDIQPMLAEKCSTCHGVLRQEAGLRLDHGQLLREGGDDGSIIDPDNVRQSRLLQRVSTVEDSERMPPEGEGEPLTPTQLRTLEAWISGGAASPADEPVPVGPDEHWAWKALEHDLPPSIESSHGPPSNPIDAFVLAKQREHGIRALPLADRRTRLRRLYFDLIGLPPTPRQMREFLADESVDAWSSVVNQLLEDPAYGERWARHWMDVWRYSDWDGYQQQVRGSQRHIWRWRDWIIESLNEDKGYDQMVVEMLAGDEVASGDASVMRATGFLVRNFHNSNRHIWLDATVEHTAKAFLAMTINCARCHDHKYDPISQRDYYAFRAIFEPYQARTERVAGQADLIQDGLVVAYDAKPDEPTYLLIGGNEKSPDKEHPLAPATPSFVDVPFEVFPVELADEAVFPSLRAFVEREDLAATQAKLAQAKQTLSELPAAADESSLEYLIAKQSVRAATAELASCQARWRADKASYVEDRTANSVDSLHWSAATLEHAAKAESAKLTLLQKQQALKSAEDAEVKEAADKQPAIDKAQKELDEAQKELAALADNPSDPSDGVQYSPVGPTYPRVSTGRRSALARWITSPRNPLTARVAVNYIWMHHFGEPLVANVFDFGLRSAEPVHRELLDWLAVELMEHKWSMKHLHRLITTSKTYQLASFSPREAALTAYNRQLDQDNQLLWRANARRLEAEVIRDSLLHVADSLDATLGGPDIDYHEGEKVPRRSVYFRHAYEKQMTMLVVFDAAGPTECYRRSPSIVPGQALALSNSPLSSDQARKLAARLRELAVNTGDNTEDSRNRRFVSQAFETLLARECTGEELDACLEFLSAQAELLADQTSLTRLPGKIAGTTPAATDAAQRARENLIHTLMNHNDFVTIR